MPYPIILYFVADVPDFSLLLLLSGLAYLFFTCFTSLNAAFSEDDDIDVIEKKLEELLRLEAKIKADFSRGSITEEHYRQSMTRLLAVREKLEAKMEDTIVAMMSPDKTA
ncbi:MAG: hypothetical protein JW709_12405, partial [Sedimentisphaerales bacterium]|nr:hypothetical protein [Sedimentisphaerales bacterium]